MRIRSAPACPRRGARGETECQCGSVWCVRPTTGRSCTYRVLYHRVAECNAPLRAPDPPAVDDLACGDRTPLSRFSVLGPLSLSPPNHFSDSKLSQQTQRAGLSRTPRRPIPHLRQLVLNRGRAPARRLLRTASVAALPVFQPCAPARHCRWLRQAPSPPLSRQRLAPRSRATGSCGSVHRSVAPARSDARYSGASQLPKPRVESVNLAQRHLVHAQRVLVDGFLPRLQPVELRAGGRGAVSRVRPAPARARAVRNCSRLAAEAGRLRAELLDARPLLVQLLLQIHPWLPCRGRGCRRLKN